jgi:NAD(P)-dependent dehydrogenase (short-subunit alcohol dehydrogenase family)
MAHTPERLAHDMAKTALITGASRGLGLAIARGLAERGGWNLLITGRDANRLHAAWSHLSELARPAGTRVGALPGDVTDESHRLALADTARAQGGLDAVVNNAGALGPSPQPPLLDYPLEVLRSVFEANTLAPLALLQALTRDLRPGARIINVTSDAGARAYTGWGGYGATKAALELWSAVLALENPELNVYWVDPGDLRTDMQQAAFPGDDISDRPLPEVRVPAFITLLEGRLPSGRYVAAQLGGAGVR